MERTCSAEDCGDPAKTRGLCGKHYMRLLRHGDIADRSRRKPIEPRFWAKVNKHGPIPKHRPELGPCWLWTGGTAGQGYGVFHPHTGEPMVYAHRFAWELLVGPIPKGYENDHLCRVHPCVKTIANEQGPAHLEPVTPEENQRRAKEADAKTHCPYGHLKDGRTRGRLYCKTCNCEKTRRLRGLKYSGRAKDVLAQLPDPRQSRPPGVGR